jgi:hypothetical protein
MLRQRRGAAGSGLGITIKYLRCTTSGATGNALGTKIKSLRRTASGAAVNGLCTTINFLLGAASICLATTIEYLRRTTRLRPGLHDQESSMHNEGRWGSGLGTMVKFLRHTTSGATGNGLSRNRGWPMCPFTINGLIAFVLILARLLRQRAERHC